MSSSSYTGHSTDIVADRDNLLAYLRPFAQEGKVVSQEDVTAFFETLKQGKAKPAN